MPGKNVITVVAILGLGAASCADGERADAPAPTANATEAGAQKQGTAAAPPDRNRVEPVVPSRKTPNARCEIHGAENEILYSGACDFRASRSGSFSIEPVGQDAFYGEILSVRVSVISPGRAEVRGLTRSGVNSRWGAATRDDTDRACWQGSDFRICAR